MAGRFRRKNLRKNANKRKKLFPNQFSDVFVGINIVRNAEIGRHVVATKDIEGCIEIGEAKPFVQVVDKTDQLYCLTCFNAERKNYDVCSDCQSVVFCSGNDCMKNNRTHVYECGSNFHNIEYGDDLYVKCAIQMVFEALVAYDDNVHTLINDVIGLFDNRNRIELSTPERITDAKSKFKAVMRLLSKSIENLELQMQKAYTIIMELRPIRRIFPRNNDNLQRFLKWLLAHFLTIIPGNCFSNISSVGEAPPKGETKRILIFDTFSYFNHSCSPNLFNFFDWNSAKLITSRPIRAGEQLCIAYQTFDQNAHKAKRRAILRNSWRFECNCERCSYAREINDNDMKKTSAIKNPRDSGKFVYKFENQMLDDIEDERQKRYWTPLIGAYGIKYYSLLHKGS